MHDEDFDLFGEPPELYLSTRKIRSKLQSDGYRSEKVIADQVEIQRGFDDGFKAGMELGRACGAFYAKCRRFHHSPHYEGMISVVEDILLRTIPEYQSLEAHDFKTLEECALRLSANLTAELEILRGFLKDV